MILPTGAAIQIWNQSATEFYYDSLHPGLTHVWVNSTTIEPITAKLFQRKGKIAELMGAVARQWFEETLTSTHIIEYYRQWFSAWAALQRFEPTSQMLNDDYDGWIHCTCSGWMGKNESTKSSKRCDYCTKYPAHIAKEVSKLDTQR